MIDPRIDGLFMRDIKEGYEIPVGISDVRWTRVILVPRTRGTLEKFYRIANPGSRMSPRYRGVRLDCFDACDWSVVTILTLLLVEIVMSLTFN